MVGICSCRAYPPVCTMDMLLVSIFHTSWACNAMQKRSHFSQSCCGATSCKPCPPVIETQALETLKVWDANLELQIEPSFAHLSLRKILITTTHHINPVDFSHSFDHHSASNLSLALQPPPTTFNKHLCHFDKSFQQPNRQHADQEPRRRRCRDRHHRQRRRLCPAQPPGRLPGPGPSSLPSLLRLCFRPWWR